MVSLWPSWIVQLIHISLSWRTHLKTSDYGFNQAQHGYEDRITIMELLHDAGYRTGHFGKWHIGPDETNGTYGIDEIIVSGGGGRDPRGRDEKIYENAIAFIEANKDVPFYMNVMGRVTHAPIDPRPDLVASAGFSGLVIDRTDFSGKQIQNIFDDAESHGGDINTAMASYLTEVFYLDQFIGELLAKLDDLGLADDTIVAFSSDQGAAVPKYKEDPVPAKEFNKVGWSGGLRGQKHDQHEGGIRSPFILRWPGNVPAGKINTDSITSALDWLPTLCRIAEVPIDPKNFHGEDVLDIWMGSDRSRNGPQFWNSSMKKDDWRIYFSNRTSTNAVELYDLSTDLDETDNLIETRPDIVAELTAIWADWISTDPPGTGDQWGGGEGEGESEGEGGVEVDFDAVEDTWVRKNKADTNYCSRTILQVRNAVDVKKTYIKFNVTGLDGADVRGATLRVHTSDTNVPVDLSVAAVTSGTFVECGLTWNNNSLTADATLDTISSLSTNAWHALDVGNVITGNGEYTFELTTSSTSRGDLISSTGGATPVLRILREGDSDSGPAAATPATGIVGLSVLVALTTVVVGSHSRNREE